jgi:NADH:ubiquinone oxidoreductase subunit 5 (subunit L)/multisubunit Na+/H+ antiporter MnhA subunit
MKFLTNKITQAKELYKRNKILGILLFAISGVLSIVFLPELIGFFAPQYIFKTVWPLKLNIFIKILILAITFAILAVIVWTFFVIVKVLLGQIFSLFKF